MKCTECGRDISDNQKFCKYCGASVRQVTFSADNMDKLKKCKSCGAVLRSETAFCTQCGKLVSAAEVKVPINTERNKAKGDKAGKIIIAITTTISLVLVVFIVCYFANQYGVFNRDKKEQTVSKSIQDNEFVPGETRTTDNVSYETSEREETSVNGNLDVIDVESAVFQIRDKYDKIVNGISSNSYDITVVDEGVIAYSEKGQIRAIVIKKDYDGYDYARNFYYDGNKLFFAYYEDTDSHRFYFNENKLIRWRYCPDVKDSSKATNYDFENTSEYYRWEKNVLADSEKLLPAWEDALENGGTAKEYILAGSDSRYILKSELQGFTAEQCRLARNEIYARHGRKFNDENIQDYFNSKDWYTPAIAPDEFEESLLNPYEIANRDLIVEYEKECGYR